MGLPEGWAAAYQLAKLVEPPHMQLTLRPKVEVALAHKTSVTIRGHASICQQLPHALPEGPAVALLLHQASWLQQRQYEPSVMDLLL